MALDIYDRVYDRCTDADHLKLRAFFDRMGEAIYKNDQEWLAHGWGGKHNNHYAWHRMALCALGLFFGNEKYVEHALHVTEGVVELMNEGLMDEGLWHESSIHYHFTALYGLVNIAEMLRHTNHPFDLYRREFARRRTLRNMFDAPLLTLFPDGTLPNVGDSYGRTAHVWDMPWYEYAYAVYGDPEHAWVLSQGKRNAAVALLHGEELKEIELPSVHSHLFREHGYAFLRSEEGRDYWGGKELVAMLNFDRNGIHCHHDHLSLTLFGGGRLLAPDPEARTTGHAFSRPVQRELNRSVICHNTVAVDGRVDQGILNEPLKVVAWHPTGEEKCIAIADDEGKVYPGVKLSRRIALRENRVLDEIRVSSDEAHTYDWLFHACDDEGVVRTNLTFSPASLPKEAPWSWIRNPRHTFTDTDWEVSWRQGLPVGAGEASPETSAHQGAERPLSLHGQGDVELRLTMAGIPGTEITACDFPQDDQFTPPPISMLIVRRNAASTTFSVAYEVRTLKLQR